MLRVLSHRSGRSVWLALGAAAVAVILLFFLYIWRLGGLTHGLSAAEVSARQGGASMQAIIHNPVNAPHKLLILVFTRLLPHHIFWLRLPSVIFGLFFLFCFYKLATNWFGKSIGIFASLVFAALPLFVISSRQATAQIMYFAPIALMWLYAWLMKKDSPKYLAWPPLVLAAAVLIYTPGMAIWVLIAFIVVRKRLAAAVKSIPPPISAASLLVLAAAAGSLTVAAAHNHTAARQLILWPAHIAPVASIFKDIGWMALSFVWKTQAHNNLIVARLPVLDILMLVILIFGFYAMQAAARTKTAVLALMILFAIIAAGINDNFALLALSLPAIGILIAAGMRYLYIEWRSIFPRNPVPKTFALALIAAVTLSQLYFGLRYSLVAWPHTPAVTSSYVLK